MSLLSRFLVRAAPLVLVAAASLHAQAGRRWPSERKVVPDPVTGVELTFLTTAPGADSKIYQTHPDWTSDGKWVVFRSDRAWGQAFAANEETGDIVQLTDRGYLGMLCVAQHSMKLVFTRDLGAPQGQRRPPPEGGWPQGGRPPGKGGGFFRPRGPFQIVELDLARLFADALAGHPQPESAYDRVRGTTPAGMHATGNMGLDANEDFVYFGITGPELAKYLPAGSQPAEIYGPRHMGSGPSGLASMNLKTGEVKIVIVVPFQIGHVQTNLWQPGEIVFCWETGGKAPQRTWTVRADGTGLRPLYPEAPYEWITHEAVISRDELAIAILAHRRAGSFPAFHWEGGRLVVAPSEPATVPAPTIPEGGVPGAEGIPSVATASAWGASGTGDHPTGIGIVNLRTREMRIVGQVPMGNPGRSVWHVNGSSDGRWAAFDDFLYRLWLVDRHTGEQVMLADLGHKTTAADHVHPTFSADGTRIQVETAMLAPNGRALDICIVPVPPSWLSRTYSDRIAR